MIYWIAPLASLSIHAAEEPCEGHSWDNRVDSEHFWVEWEDGLISELMAEQVLEVLEDSRVVFAEELLWEEPPYPIVAEVYEPPLVTASGRCITMDCDGVAVPHIELYPGVFDIPVQYSVPAHELGHAFEYAYMGDYIDSITSWIWWMEGTATWITLYTGLGDDSWGYAVDHYLARPQLSLHHGPEAFLDPDRSGHMYGTALLASFIDQSYGGPDAVRATWEYGADHSGTEIWFPDALAAQGIDFDAFWAHYLAMVSVADIDGAELLRGGPALSGQVSSLPSSGAPDADLQPEGLGLSVVQFDAAAGASGKALSVSFTGDAAVPWHVVLVRTAGTAVGSQVEDWVRFEIGSDGTGTAVLSGFDGTAPGFLVASPEAADSEAHAYSWSAELVDEPTTDEKKGCACSTRPALRWGAWLLGLPLLIALRRRSSSTSPGLPRR